MLGRRDWCAADDDKRPGPNARRDCDRPFDDGEPDGYTASVGDQGAPDRIFTPCSASHFARSVANQGFVEPICVAPFARHIADAYCYDTDEDAGRSDGHAHFRGRGVANSGERRMREFSTMSACAGAVDHGR